MNIEINKFLPEIFFFKLRKLIYFLTIFFSIIQLFISSFDLNVFLIIIFINFVSILNLEIALNREKLLFYIIPASIVIFTNFFYLLLPLIIKTSLGQNILNNLDIGFESFQISIIFVIIISLSFSLFVKITNYSNIITLKRELFTNLNVFKYFNLKSVIVIFFITISIKSYLVIYQNSFVISEDFGNIFVKFLFGFDKFFYLPLILIFNLYYTNKITKSFFIIFLSVNFLLSIFFGISTNSRTEIFEMLTIIFFCYLIYFVQGKIKINRGKFIFIIFLLIVFSFALDAISKRILEFRSLMTETTPIELFKITAGLSDVDYKIVDVNIDQNQEYIYTGNNILDRFTPIKHLDKSLYDSSFFGFSDYVEFSKFTKIKMLSFFPQNITQIFIRNYNKIDYQIATGSKIERLAYNRFGGNRNKGSYITELLLLTNSYFFTFLLTALINLLFFSIVSLFQKIEQGKIILSPIIILLIFNILYASQSDSMTSFITFFIRQPIEIILLTNILLIFTFKDTKISRN